jgi:hemoglobin
VDDHGAHPRPDLTGRNEVHRLVVDFYREVVFDELLEPVFGEVAEVDWAAHLPTLVDYWCRILHGTPTPPFAVMATHRHLHSMRALRPEHCDRWYELWVDRVEAGWSGPYADKAVHHAAALMSGMARRVFGFAWAPPATRSDAQFEVVSDRPAR